VLLQIFASGPEANSIVVDDLGTLSILSCVGFLACDFSL